MTATSIMLVGGPASGKTNYIARLWLAFQARKGSLRADKLPSNIQYVDDAVRHLMALKFAPRSDRNIDAGRRDFEVDLRGNNGHGPARTLQVPDITGELWKRAIANYELPDEWMEALRGSSSAILFVRAHSKFNAQPVDWVTARDVLNMHLGEIDDDLDNYDEDEEDEESLEAPLNGAVHDLDSAGDNAAQVQVGAPAEDIQPEQGVDEAVSSAAGPKLPAQVGFCELLRFLSLLLADRPDGSRPRVAVVVTAWDMLDATARNAGPMQYLQDQFPFLAGRIQTPGRLEIETFGMSIVGGDLRGKPEFRASLKGVDLSTVGYTAVMRDGIVVEDPDVALPIAWALGD